MSLEDTKIREIVARVMSELDGGSKPVSDVKETNNLSASRNPPLYRGVFESVEEAMCAVQAAQKQFQSVSLARRKALINAIREASIKNAQMLAEMAVDESRMGRVADKVAKHLLVAEKTPGVEEVPSGAFIGDYGLTTEEPAPFGLILAVTPTTNPTSTIFSNAICMLAAGNTVFFAPHPRALKTALTTIDIINEAIEKAGGPANLIVALSSVKLDVVQGLMQHPDVALLCITGGTGVVDQAMRCGKRVIGAAAGNPPVLVDDTADPEKAARDIVLGHSFDNNLPCIAEKEVIVTEGIADRLMAAFRARDNAVVLDQRYLKALEEVVLNKDRSGPNSQMIGKNACVILRELGIDANDEMRAIIIETDKNHPFVRHELMLPVLAVVRTRNFEEAMKVAVEVEGGLRHSAIIHSSDIYHMSAFGKAINTTIYVKNAPSYAGIGMGGEGHNSFTIAGRTGEGVVSVRTFTRLRRCTLVGAFSKS